MDPHQNSPWQYKPDGQQETPGTSEDSSSPTAEPKSRTPKVVAWKAPEFIEHPHGAGWYGGLALATLFIAAFVYLTSKDFFATGTILIVGIIVGVFVRHKPGEAEYEISHFGLSINGRAYPFNTFKSFTILREGAINSVNLFPLKRFMPPISAYFDPAKEGKILEALGDHLPYEQRQMDSIDRLSRRLRL